MKVIHPICRVCGRKLPKGSAFGEIHKECQKEVNKKASYIVRETKNYRITESKEFKIITLYPPYSPRPITRIAKNHGEVVESYLENYAYKDNEAATNHHIELVRKLRGEVKHR